jgi:carbamoyl-phosphate synthase large subunit
MGVGDTFAEAYFKATVGAGERLPTGGRAFISVRDADKPGIAAVAEKLIGLGFKLFATRGTQKVLADAGLASEPVNKVAEGRPHIVDMLKNDEFSLIVNTTEGRQAIADSATIRRTALGRKVFYTTTLAGADAVAQAIEAGDQATVRRIQDFQLEI